PYGIDDLGERLPMLGIGVDGIERSGGDAVFDLEIAANRGDLMSHLGVARELAAATRTAARPPAGSLRADSAVGSDAVRVEARGRRWWPRPAGRPGLPGWSGGRARKSGPRRAAWCLRRPAGILP